MMITRWAAVAILLSSATITDLRAEEGAGGPIKIGAIIPLTGGGASLGKSELNGAMLAMKQINGNGGVNGRPISIIHEDDRTNADTAISKANELIYGQKVVALIGPGQTASTVAVGGITDPLKIPILSYSGLGPEVEKTRKCVLHMAPAQDLNAKAMLSYAKSVGATRVGVLYDSGFGTIVFTQVNRFAADYGVTIVASEKFEIAATDTTTQAAKVRAANPEALLVLGVTGTPIRNLRALQMNQLIISSIAQATYPIVAAMGENISDVVFAEFLVAEDPLPNQTEFVKLYTAAYGAPPKAPEALGWDSVQAIAAALKKVGPNPPQGALCDALRNPYQGVTAAYDFSAPDMTGMTLKSYVFSKITNSKFSRVPFKID